MAFPRVLVVGLGSIGRRHVRNLRARGVTEIVAFRARGVDTRPLADDERVETVGSLEDGLAWGPDIVFVTNATALHLETARAAVEAGAHVFVEKPLSHDLAGVDDLLAQARARRRHIMVGCNLRFHPVIARARQLLAEGAIGRPVSARFSVGEYLPDFHPWEDHRDSYAARRELGGGVLLTQIHDIDLMVWFFGMPTRVSATVAAVGDLGIDVEDLAVVSSEYDRLIAEVHLDYLERPGRRWFLVVGTGGKLEWSQADGGLVVWRHGEPEPTIYPAPAGYGRNDMFLAEVDHVLRVVDGAEAPAVDGPAGRDALLVVDAARRAAARGRTVPLAGPADRDLFDLAGRVAIVTGAAGLLGAEYVDELARAGAIVVATDCAEARLRRVATEAAAATRGTVVPVVADLTNRDDIERLVAETMKGFGRIDILVNNAAMNPVPGSPESERQFAPFEDYPRELWEQELSVNLTGMFLVTQRVGREMARAGRGSIINVSSTYGNVGPDQRIYPPGRYKSIGYAVTKSGVLNFTRYLAAYWGGTGVRVNTLTPGGVEAEQDGAFVRAYSERTMLGRMARRHEYRGAVRFLASDASSYMTGANLVVDGGWTAW